MRAGEIPAQLPESERALLEYALAATRAPHAARHADLARLRELGHDERAILDAVLTIAYFNFVNRIVLLLGVDIEEGFERFCG